MCKHTIKFRPKHSIYVPCEQRMAPLLPEELINSNLLSVQGLCNGRGAKMEETTLHEQNSMDERKLELNLKLK